MIGPTPGGYKNAGRKRVVREKRSKRGLGALQKRRNGLIERSMDLTFGIVGSIKPR